jgi:hypothetical protein
MICCVLIEHLVHNVEESGRPACLSDSLINYVIQYYNPMTLGEMDTRQHLAKPCLLQVGYHRILASFR